MYKRPKYGNKKVEYQGIVFDSGKERDRFIFLKDAESKGLISGLQRQVTYELIPNQYREKIVQMKTKTKVVKRLLHRKLTYTADFVYLKDDTLVVEDVKASKKMIPKEFSAKFKLMSYIHGLDVRLVFKANEEI